METATRSYEWMVKSTPQQEWIEKRGIMLWLAFFFLELGAGTFIVAAIFNSLLGMFVGWLICAIGGGGFHMLYLGHPLRFWRILLSGRFTTSWISRGLTFTLVFLILGAIYMILAQWASPSFGLLIAAGIFALFSVAYAGFALNFVNGIPLWNTPLLPALYIILGIWGGLGINLIIMLATGATSAVHNIEQWSQIFLITFIVIVFLYLFGIRYQTSFSSTSTGKISVKNILAGKWSPLFWIMVVALGMALPLGVAIGSWASGWAIPGVFLSVVIAFEILGDLSLRYCILRNGLYTPLIPL